jgi:hypothetical protein
MRLAEAKPKRSYPALSGGPSGAKLEFREAQLLQIPNGPFDNFWRTRVTRSFSAGASRID